MVNMTDTKHNYIVMFKLMRDINFIVITKK